MYNIPKRFTAGDYQSWVSSIANYPATLYTARLEIVGSANKLSIVSTPSGTDHQFQITSASSANLQAGQYSYQFTVTNGSGNRTTLDSGAITVAPNLAVANTTQPLTINQQHLQAVDAAISAVLSGGAVQSYSIRGRSLNRYSLNDLYALKEELSRAVAREQNAETGRGQWVNLYWGQR
jgi:2',3'-cyclic-nucleotide 2'-phosphodiesterase (5'-nucleotidase family)